MLDYDPKTSLQHYPMQNLSRFGTTPYGDSLYRIVFAPSRRNLVGGMWPDGEIGYKWAPTYSDLGSVWVLERWMPASEFAGTKEDWDARYVDPNSGYLLLGPYPNRGEHQHCHTFSTSIGDSNLDKLVSWIEEGHKRRFVEHKAACQKHYDDQKQENRGKMDAIIRNALPAFGSAPMIGYKGGRGSKTVPILRSAQELGLPIGNNKFATRGQRRRKVA